MNCFIKYLIINCYYVLHFIPNSQRFMRIFKSVLLNCTIIVFLSSCGQIIEDKFDDFAPTPILIGILEADSTFCIQVGITANLTDTVPTLANNAIVIISNTSNTPDTLQCSTNGKYISHRKVKAGETYSCVVKIEGFKTITGQTTVPIATMIDSVNFTEKASKTDGGSILSSFDFMIKNIANKEEYWEVGFELDGVFHDFYSNYTTTHNYNISMPSGQDPVMLNEAIPLNLFSDKSMSTSQYKVKFMFYKAGLYYLDFPDDVIDSTMIVLKSVDKSYYEYVKNYYIYQTGKEYGFSFSSQHYPLYSNIENGYGIFTSFSTCRYRYKFEE